MGDPRHPRITMTLRAITDTRFLALHVTGAGKRAVLDRAKEPGPVSELPIRAMMRQARAPMTIYAA
jgi:6-phosphogluconolactonase